MEDYLKGSKKTEAKVSLNVIYTAQKIYFVTHQTYVDTMSKLDVQLDSQGSAFYIINLSGNNTFSTATAIGNLDVDAVLDICKVYQNKTLQNTINDITSE